MSEKHPLLHVTLPPTTKCCQSCTTRMPIIGIECQVLCWMLQDSAQFALYRHQGMADLVKQ